MFYNSIKIIHILSAALLMTTMVICFIRWRINSASIVKSIGILTALLIIPFALLQLVTGFTLLSLHPEYLSERWAQLSIELFVGALAGWFLFLYFVLKEKKYPRWEITSALLCLSSLLGMIFLMANKP